LDIGVFTQPGAIEAAELDDLEDLRIVVMRRQRLEFRFRQRGAVMQRIDRCDQGLLGSRPAWRVGSALHRGADLLLGEAGGIREGRDMHAPFVFASGQRTGPVDDDFAVPQR
jgi:hypothetical protein